MGEVLSSIILDECAKEAIKGMTKGEGGPFGSLILKLYKETKKFEIVGRGHNSVIADNDPTAHGEINAIRDACNNLETFDLSDCILFTSSEPCPMCISAIRWARIDIIIYANTKKDAANIGFSDDEITKELLILFKYDESNFTYNHIPNKYSEDTFKLYKDKFMKNIKY